MNKEEDKIIDFYNALKSDGIVKEELTELLYHTICIAARIVLRTKTPLNFHSIGTDGTTKSGCFVFASMKEDANERMRLFAQILKGVEQSPQDIMAAEVYDNLIGVFVMIDFEYSGVENKIQDSQCRHYFREWCKQLQIQKTEIQTAKTASRLVNMRYLQITKIDQKTDSILSAVDVDSGKTIDVPNTIFRVSTLFKSNFEQKFPILVPKRMQISSDREAVRITVCEFIDIEKRYANFLDISGENEDVILKLSSPEVWAMDYAMAIKYGFIKD